MSEKLELADVIQIYGEFAGELMRTGPGTLFQMLRKADLSMPQLVTLLFVRRCNTASISSISEHLNLSLGATSQLVDRLVVGGFVERAEAPNDRRQKQVTLTPAGRTLVEEIDRARVEDTARRLLTLPAPLLRTLVLAMRDAVDHLRVTSAATATGWRTEADGTQSDEQ